MKNSILKIALFAIISLSTTLEAKSQDFDLLTPNNSAYAFQITIFDASSNVLWSANIPANTSPTIVYCLTGTPDNVTFANGGCSYNIPINSGGSSGCPLGTCPCAAFGAGTTTFESTFAIGGTCWGNGRLVTITIN